MKRQLLRVMFAMFAIVSLTACPSDEGSASDGTAADGTPDSTAQAPLTASAIQGAICARQAECCPGNEDLATCQARTMAWENFLTVANFSVDQVALQACLDRLATADCSAVAAWAGVPPLVDWCEPWFSEVAANGQACGTTATGGAAIVRNVFSDRECVSGYCESHVCRAPRAEDEACEFSATACESGLRCHMQVCIPEQRAGDSCHERNVCADGTVCGQAELCVVPTVVAVGAPCEGDSVCELGPGTCRCPDGSGCSDKPTVCGNTARCLP